MTLTIEQKACFQEAEIYFQNNPQETKWKKMGSCIKQDPKYYKRPSFIKIDDRILMIENSEHKIIGEGSYAKVIKCCDKNGAEYAVRISFLQNENENISAKMLALKEKGLTDFNTHMIRKSESQETIGIDENNKYPFKIYEPLFRGKPITSFINECEKLAYNSSEYKKQKLTLAIKAFHELEENYCQKNYAHLDIKKNNMVVFFNLNRQDIKFIDVTHYEFETNPNNTSEVRFTNNSGTFMYTDALYLHVFRSTSNYEKRKFIDEFIKNTIEKNYQDKKNFFCYDRLTLLNALTNHDVEHFFLGAILKQDAELAEQINNIIHYNNYGETNPFDNIFLEKQNLLKTFFIILRADIKIDFDNLLKLATKNDVIDKILKNPDNSLTIFRALKNADIQIQNEDSKELLEINIKSLQR